MAKGTALRDLSSVVDSLYSAGLRDEGWELALARMTGFVGGAGTVSFLADRRDGRIRDIAVQGVESGRDDYVARMHRINPRMRYSLDRPGPHIAWDYKLLPEEDIRRHEFYDWLERANGLRYFIGARVFDSGALSLFTSVEFTPRQGHPQEQRLNRFRQLLPHVANAWRIRRLVARARAQAGLVETLQELVPWGVIALDRQGKVLFMNARAQDALDQNDGLTVVSGELSALRSADHRALQRLIGAALADTDAQSPPAGGILAVARPSGAAAFVLRVVPLPRNAVVPLDDLVAALVMIDDLAAPCDRGFDHLATLFGLTRREAALAALLGKGHPLPAAARSLGIAHNTARAHLRSICLKTETHSQAQLIALIARLRLA